jgi:hypothetical protein
VVTPCRSGNSRKSMVISWPTKASSGPVTSAGELGNRGGTGR